MNNAGGPQKPIGEITAASGTLEKDSRALPRAAPHPRIKSGAGSSLSRKGRGGSVGAVDGRAGAARPYAGWTCR